MKKVYRKPEIMFESFTLSTNIAACMNEVDFTDDLGAACKGYYDEQFGAVLFTNQAQGCVFTPSMLNNDKLCYDVPTISYNLLGS